MTKNHNPYFYANKMHKNTDYTISKKLSVYFSYKKGNILG